MRLGYIFCLCFTLGCSYLLQQEPLLNCGSPPEVENYIIHICTYDPDTKARCCGYKTVEGDKNVCALVSCQISCGSQWTVEAEECVATPNNESQNL